MYTLIHADLHEEQLALTQLLEKFPYTLLYFYPKDDTPGCTLEAKEFSALHKEFAKQGVQIVGVSRDLAPSHCSFIQKYNLQPLYLSDPELILHKQFGARGQKNSWGKIFGGVIRSTVLLDTSGNLLHTRSNVRASGHAKKLLNEMTTYLHPTS